MSGSAAIEATQQLVIRRPASEVFRAFADPEITTKFWFGRSTGPLDSVGGFSLVLAAAKAWLEHGVALQIVADKH